MQTLRVVPTLNPAEHSQARFGLGLPDTPVNQLTLQRGKEALGHGVVRSYIKSSICEVSLSVES